MANVLIDARRKPDYAIVIEPAVSIKSGIETNNIIALFE
jgi:hypothetical protein